MGQYLRSIKIGKRWYSKGQHLGIPYCSRAIFLTKKQAGKWERAKKEQIEAEARNPVIDMSLKDLLTYRLDELEASRNRFYYEDNKRHAKQILDALGNVQVSQVTKKQVYDLFMAEMRRCKRAGLTNHRANAFLVNMRSFFNFGINRLGLEYRNPCAGLAKLPVDRRIKFIPTQEMIDEVISICTPEQAELIRFVDETACRIGEALRVEAKDFIDAGVVLYTRKAKGSNLTPRVVPISCLFLTVFNSKMFDYKRAPDFLEAKINKLSQPKWNWHALRHRRASIWANEGKPLIQIMALLGHQNISTTQIYLRSLGIAQF